MKPLLVTYQSELRCKVINKLISCDKHTMMLCNKAEQNGKLEVCEILNMVPDCLY